MHILLPEKRWFKISKPTAKRSRRESTLILILAAAVMIFLGWHFTGADLYSDINELLIKRENLRHDQSALQSIVQGKEEIEKTWAVLQLEKDNLYTLIPDLDQLPLVLGRLESLLNNHAGALQLIKIGDTNYNEDYVTVGLTLHLAGQTDHLQNLLQQLEEFPHLVIADQISLFNFSNTESKLELQLKLVFIHPTVLTSG
ncbi:MAG: GspMb/PilO family protein [Bacillota bacterium]